MKNKLFFTSLLSIMVIIIALTMMNTCTPKPKPTPQLDSLRFANQMLSKQYGLMSAEAQAQSLRAARAEILARERDTIYLTRTKTIFKQAPDTCQPYLLALKSECDTLIEMHRTVSLAKDTLLEIKDSLISNRNEVIHNDSITKVELSKQLVKSDKKAKRAKFFTKVVAWSAAILVGVVAVLGVGG